MITARRIETETWQAIRDAYLLGASLRDAAERYGLNYETVKRRATREKWPKPREVVPIANAPTLPPPTVVAGESLARRGELHRERVAALVEQALAAALPPALESWSDIATAVKLGNQAFGLDSAASVVSINFPATSSTESPGFIDISTNFPPATTMDPPPIGGTPLHLPEVPAP